MFMDGIVPGKEFLTKRSGILDGSESARKSGGIFQGFELRFRIGIVITDMRSGMGFGHTQVSQQMGDQF